MPISLTKPMPMPMPMPMPAGTRIVYRETGHGWATVTIGGVLQKKKIRSNTNALVSISNAAKADGAQGVSWGVCGTGLWVGFSW